MQHIDIETFSKDPISLIETTARERDSFVVVSKVGSVVIMDEAKYRDLAKAAHNEAYVAMLDRADQQLEAGEYVVKSIDELEALTK